MAPGQKKHKNQGKITKSTKSEQVNQIGLAKCYASETLPVGYEAVRRTVQNHIAARKWYSCAWLNPGVTEASGAAASLEVVSGFRLTTETFLEPEMWF